jgi:hypothetical protein
MNLGLEHERPFVKNKDSTPKTRVHKTLRVTPAMEAGVSDHVWTLEELLSLKK